MKDEKTLSEPFDDHVLDLLTDKLTDACVNYGTVAILKFVDKLASAIGNSGQIVIRRLPDTGDFSVTLRGEVYGRVNKYVREECLFTALARSVDPADLGDRTKERERQRKELDGRMESCDNGLPHYPRNTDDIYPAS